MTGTNNLTMVSDNRLQNQRKNTITYKRFIFTLTQFSN